MYQLLYFPLLTKETDSAAPAMYWSFIETSLATVCACLPVLRPLFVQISLENFLGKIRSSLFSTHRSSKLDESSINGSPPPSLDCGARPQYLGSGLIGEHNVGATISSHENYADHLPLVNVTGSQERPLKSGEILVRSEIRQNMA